MERGESTTGRRNPRGNVLRVAVWGVGPHARRRVLPALAACRETELAGLTTRDGAVLREEAERYGCCAWETADAMLKSPDVDVVYLATPTGLHGEQGRRVLLAGKHLWCEKPFTTDVATTEELLSLSRERGLMAAEALMYLHHPQFVRIRELATERRELGAPCSLVARFTMPMLERPGFRYARELGGGALLDVACYPLSLVLALTDGEPRVLLSRLLSRPGVDVDIAGHALLACSGSLFAHLEWGYGRGYVNEVMITGESGSLYSDRVFSKLDGYEASIELSDARGGSRTERFAPADPFQCMLEVFARAYEDDATREELRRETARRSLGLAALRSAGELFDRSGHA